MAPGDGRGQPPPIIFKKKKEKEKRGEIEKKKRRGKKKEIQENNITNDLNGVHKWVKTDNKFLGGVTPLTLDFSEICALTNATIRVNNAPTCPPLKIPWRCPGA